MKEKYGFVCVFLGDLPEEERPPMPEIPELDDPSFKKVYGEYYWDVNYERAIENAMDPSHAAFVHGNRFGNPDNPQVADFEVKLTPWSGTRGDPALPAAGQPQGHAGAGCSARRSRTTGEAEPMRRGPQGRLLPAEHHPPRRPAAVRQR